MFRSFFIFLSKAEWAKKLIMSMGLTRNMAHRFIAGETLNEAMQVVRELNQKGINATFDHLGESTRSHEQARQATQDILQMLDMLEQEQARSNVSIKLTQIGLALDEAFCAENLRQILTVARERHNFVRIDMEDHPTVDATLRIYWQMRQEHGLDNTGLVIQSYLYRSEADVRALMEAQTTIRLCKGAYKEPPEVAFPKKLDVDANFDRLTRILMDTAKAASGEAPQCRRAHPAHPRHRHARRAAGGVRPGVRPPDRVGAGQLRVPDAARYPPRPAGAAGAAGLPCAGLRAVGDAVVPVLHAPPG
jgi:proline dehydrogenase